MILEMKVRGDRIFCDTEELASGSEQTVELRFDLDPAWDGYAGTAVMFRSFGTQYCVPLQGGGCPVPAALLSGTGRLYIGIFGSKDDKIVTTGFTSVALFGGASDGNMPEPPEAYVYTRLLDMVSKAVNDVSALRLEVVAKIDGHRESCDALEEDRSLAETARRAAELERQEAENARAAAEQKRAAEESDRAAAEEKRRLADLDRDENCVSKSYLHSYVEDQIGDISAAFDELHAYAQAIIDGGVEV